MRVQQGEKCLTIRVTISHEEESTERGLQVRLKREREKERERALGEAQRAFAHF